MAEASVVPSSSTRICSWCSGPIPAAARRDAVCCSVRCRQARHRFARGVGDPVASRRGEKLRLAYADPPYPGLSKRYYGEHPDFGGEVDHPALIASLAAFDGWALSTSARALPEVLASCPPGVRVAAWHRGDRHGRSRGPANAWEPVIYFGGRDASFAADGDASRGRASRRVASDVERDASAAPGGRDASVDPSSSTTRLADPHDALRYAGATRRVDSLVYAAKPRLTDPNRVVGAKPAVFCRWIFDLLGAEPHDDFTDLFPGSGGVLRAWDIFSTPTTDPRRSPEYERPSSPSS
ncbi:hypothetical protein GTU73_08880 [Rathayibacter sp. VKM Ac-2804]|uniref:hypothetical protein n=1 Tax=Rathayibacter sp. VKM Ac-2804 TaxID=2609257 RepID=UPI00132EDA66|nr:hypothetical protein [Rathayibacter sp. VKM Ac-2804]QHF24113.1 hypothetical protein GTU73_08880 [Rathayibacter sp. VKM Ac-2804]